VPRSTRDAGVPPSTEAIEDDIQAKRDQAWNSYRASLSEAWKSPVGQHDPNRAAAINEEYARAVYQTPTAAQPFPMNYPAVQKGGA
jgi:hypothetical protein